MISLLYCLCTRIKTEPVTVGADATEYVRFLCQIKQKPDICKVYCMYHCTVYHSICFSRERIIIFLQKFRLFLGQCRSNNSQPLQALVGVMKKTNLTFKFPFPPCFGAQYNPSCLGPLGTVSYSWRKSI